jgi:hypothetical protein
VRAAGKSAAIGESLSLGSAAHVQVAIEAPAAAGGQLVIVINGRRGQPIAIDAQGRARGEPAAVAGYIRFELVRADGSPAAFTNPVYLVP